MIAIKKTLKIHLLFILFFSQINSFSFGQNDINLYGQVFGGEETLPGASIYIQNTLIGTVSNDDGFFSLKIGRKYFELNLFISFIGYNDTVISIKRLIASKKNKIILHKQFFKIDEIVIRPFNVLDTLTKAIDLIKDNYFLNPIKLNSFYRTIEKKNSTYMRITECVSDMYYSSYSDTFDIKSAEAKFNDFNTSDESVGYSTASLYDYITNPLDQAKILALNVSEDYNDSRVYYYIPGGPLNITSLDKVKYKNNFLSKKILKKYDFEYLGISGNIYAIKFKPKKEKENTPFAGTIYLDLTSLAFVCFDFNQIYKWNDYYPKYKVKIDYMKIDKLWIIRHIKKTEQKISTIFLKDTTLIDTIQNDYEFIVNNIDTLDVKRFKDDVVFENKIKNFLYKSSIKKDTIFWHKFNKIYPSNIERTIIKEFEKNAALKKKQENYFDKKTGN